VAGERKKNEAEEFDCGLWRREISYTVQTMLNTNGASEKNSKVPSGLTPNKRPES